MASASTKRSRRAPRPEGLFRVCPEKGAAVTGPPARLLFTEQAVELYPNGFVVPIPSPSHWKQANLPNPFPTGVPAPSPDVVRSWSDVVAVMHEPDCIWSTQPEKEFVLKFLSSPLLHAVCIDPSVDPQVAAQVIDTLTPQVFSTDFSVPCKFIEAIAQFYEEQRWWLRVAALHSMVYDRFLIPTRTVAALGAKFFVTVGGRKRLGAGVLLFLAVFFLSSFCVSFFFSTCLSLYVCVSFFVILQPADATHAVCFEQMRTGTILNQLNTTVKQRIAELRAGQDNPVSATRITNHVREAMTISGGQTETEQAIAFRLIGTGLLDLALEYATHLYRRELPLVVRGGDGTLYRAIQVLLSVHSLWHMLGPYAESIDTPEVMAAMADPAVRARIGAHKEKFEKDEKEARKAATKSTSAPTTAASASSEEGKTE